MDKVKARIEFDRAIVDLTRFNRHLIRSKLKRRASRYEFNGLRAGLQIPE